MGRHLWADGVTKMVSERFKNLEAVINLEVGDTVTVKRKPTNENYATIVLRTIKSIDNEKKTITCDDNIVYEFKNIVWRK
jgi:hypothetical protein